MDTAAMIALSTAAAGAWFISLAAGAKLQQKPDGYGWYMASTISVQLVVALAWIGGRYLAH